MVARGGRGRGDGAPVAVEAFVEELLVRRELAVNYVHHEPDYDRYSALPDWARKSLEHIRQVEQEHVETINSQPQIDRRAAKRMLVSRLDELAREYGFAYNRVFVRNQKTLWGSCSHQNNINLNVNLVRLRSELMDYVILHELVHTQIKNHSRRFWATLDQYVGNAKKLDKELKTHVLGLSVY